MLDIEYLSPAAAGERIRSSTGILGVLGFPHAPAEAAAFPSANVGAPNAHPSSVISVCEVWRSRDPVRQGSSHGIRYGVSGDYLFGVLTLAEADGLLVDRAHTAYARLFRLIDELECPYVLRFWNYLPRINAAENGVERYRLFNEGRHAAFEAAGRLHPESIPAACALGTHLDDSLVVYFIASRTPGRAIENPRQVSAWRYPVQYGPRSPTFARAVMHPQRDPKMLFVSGTASIVGHETLHVGDPAAQSRETLENLRTLFEASNRAALREAFTPENASFKAYIRDPAHTAIVRAELERSLGSDADITYLRADICRADLLMEVEALCTAAA